MSFMKRLRLLGIVPDQRMSPSAAEIEIEDEDEDENEDEDETETDEEKPVKEEKSGARGARQRERARCEAILGSAEAKGRTGAACALAFRTEMTSAEACKVLATMPKSAKGRLAAAMATVKQPDLGTGGRFENSGAGAPTRAGTLADHWFAGR